MKLSRERKVYVAVLTVGAGLLGADQFLGGPSSANASTKATAADAPENATALSGKEGDASKRVDRIALHEQLERMSLTLDDQRAGLAFAIDSTWLAELTPVEQEPPATGLQVTPQSGPSALPKITMVFEDASGGVAVMNGEAIRVGERTKDGSLLVSLAKGVAVVEIGGVEHTVKVSADPESKPR